MKTMRYIRYRVCRSIYYADQCPVENRKNYSTIGKTVAAAIGVTGLMIGLVTILVAMA